VADVWYCPNKKCPYALKEKEAYMREFPGKCPYCKSKLVEESFFIHKEAQPASAGRKLKYPLYLIEDAINSDIHRLSEIVANYGISEQAVKENWEEIKKTFIVEEAKDFIILKRERKQEEK
jgi:hypothetical protein